MIIFNKLFDASDKYLEKCKWMDIALLKFCLCAIGILIGMRIPKDKRNAARVTAGIVFTAAYVPLMAKFLPFLIDEFKS